MEKETENGEIRKLGRLEGLNQNAEIRIKKTGDLVMLSVPIYGFKSLIGMYRSMTPN